MSTRKYVHFEVDFDKTVTSSTDKDANIMNVGSLYYQCRI